MNLWPDDAFLLKVSVSEPQHVPIHDEHIPVHDEHVPVHDEHVPVHDEHVPIHDVSFVGTFVGIKQRLTFAQRCVWHIPTFLTVESCRLLEDCASKPLG